MRSIRRILVAVEDTEAKGNAALVKAAQLARASGARIEIFHGIATASRVPRARRGVRLVAVASAPLPI